LGGTGVASFSTASLAEGTHTINAFYSGSPGSYNVSSGSIAEQVDTPTTVSANQYCNEGGNTIPSGAAATVYPSHIFVSGRAGAIAGLTLELDNFAHTFGKDFAALLAGPSGTDLVAWAGVGGSGTFSGLNFTLSDSAASVIPTSSVPASGSYRPTAVTTPVFPSPAAGPFAYAATAGSTTFASAFNGLDPNGTWSLYAENALAGSSGSIGKWCINLTLTPPVLGITKTHSGSFAQGQTGATYTVTVTNLGPGSTAGAISVLEIPPATGMTVTGLAGTNWSCNVGTLTCTRSDALAASASYEPITVTVSIASDAASSLTNKATVSGGGSTGTVSALDATTITQAPDLTITKSHSGLFYQGQTGATYTLTVTNSSTAATAGTVSVVDTLPAGLTATGIGGTGWSCTLATLTCTRSDVLAGSASYPAITLTVNVAANAAASVTNQATVSGGGEINTSNDTANDVTSIDVAPTVTSFKVLWGSQSYELIGTGRTRLPWQISGIQVTFSKPITAGGTASLTGLSATGISGLGTSTLTWTFSPVALATVTSTLAGTGTNALTDAAGAALTAGAGYSIAWKVLYGDFNDSGVVDAVDLSAINTARSASYNILADMNGDGVVNATDVSLARTRLGTTLP
jgi:uncharacterized repeat protein (TIGR01451 family)